MCSEGLKSGAVCTRQVQLKRRTTRPSLGQFCNLWQAQGWEEMGSYWVFGNEKSKIILEVWESAYRWGEMIGFFFSLRVWCVCVNISSILICANKSLEPSKVYCQFKFASASTSSYCPTSFPSREIWLWNLMSFSFLQSNCSSLWPLMTSFGNVFWYRILQPPFKTQVSPAAVNSLLDYLNVCDS